MTMNKVSAWWRSRVLSPTNFFFKWSPVTHYFHSMVNGKNVLHAIENPFFSFTKESKGDIIKWKDHVDMFLRLSRYNYGQTITEDCHFALLIKLQSKFGIKGVENSVVTSSYCMHKVKRALQTAERCTFEILPHPACSPELAKPDFLFPNLKTVTQRMLLGGTMRIPLKLLS